jgi:hypothetical protein
MVDRKIHKDRKKINETFCIYPSIFDVAPTIHGRGVEKDWQRELLKQQLADKGET